MYEFRAKTPTQYDFMSRVSPSRFEANSSLKMDSSILEKEEEKWNKGGDPLDFRSPSSAMVTWDLGVARLLMRSCFAWLAITEWFSLLWKGKCFVFEHKWVFHTDMNSFLIALAECECDRAPSPSSSQYLVWCTIMPPTAGQIHSLDTRQDER